jgi:hypothetical protein
MMKDKANQLGGNEKGQSINEMGAQIRTFDP